MVSVKIFVASLASYAAIFAAAAPATAAGEVEERASLKAQASIYMCSDIRWRGTCKNVLVNIDDCGKQARCRPDLTNWRDCPLKKKTGES